MSEKKKRRIEEKLSRVLTPNNATSVLEVMGRSQLIEKYQRKEYLSSFYSFYRAYGNHISGSVWKRFMWHKELHELYY